MQDQRDFLFIVGDAEPIGAIAFDPKQSEELRTWADNPAYAGFTLAVICSSTRPLVSTPTSHSAIAAIRNVSANVCST